MVKNEILLNQTPKFNNSKILYKCIDKPLRKINRFTARWSEYLCYLFSKYSYLSP